MNEDNPMTGRLEELLDSLYNEVKDAKSMPFNNEKCVVERDRILNVIEEIRTAIPGEISEAQLIVSARTDYINTARSEADAIRQVAQEEADKASTQEEIYRLAVEKSRQMIETAETKSRDLRNSANRYVEETIRSAEENVRQAAEELKQLRTSFTQAIGPKTEVPTAQQTTEE